MYMSIYLQHICKTKETESKSKGVVEGNDGNWGTNQKRKSIWWIPRSSLLNKEKDYIEYLREERQRAFFVTSHSIVGTVRKPYIGKGGLQDYYIGERGQYTKGKPRGTKVGRDGRTSRQRLNDMRQRPGFAKRFNTPRTIC